jgi:hypothetical protein
MMTQAGPHPLSDDVETQAMLLADARHADVLQHLAALPEACPGAITAFHVIEHLSVKLLLRFIEEAQRTLRSGGALILETPNPENTWVGSCTFYNDITHLNPIPPLLGQFRVESQGFVDVNLIRLRPYPAAHRVPEDTEVARRFNDLIYGPQDYAVIARKTWKRFAPLSSCPVTFPNVVCIGAMELQDGFLYAAKRPTKSKCRPHCIRGLQTTPRLTLH